MRKRVFMTMLFLAMILSLCMTTAMAAPPAPPTKESDDYSGPVIDYPDKKLWFDSTIYGGHFSAYQIMKGNGDNTFDIDAFINSKQGELTMNRVKYELALIGNGKWAGKEMADYWKSQGVIETTHDADDPTHEWITYVPEYMYAKENADKAYPVVFALHGNGNDLFTSQNLGFVHICYDNGFIVVTPEAENSDAAYMVENLPVFLDKLEAEGCPIDRSRVYVGGMSKGGQTTLSVGLACSGTVAAIAPHSSVFGMMLEDTSIESLLQGQVSTMKGSVTQAQLDACGGMPIWLQVGESDMNQLPLAQGVIDSLNAWLSMNDCPTKATATDSNIIGITADKVYTQKLDGTTYTFAEFYNTDDVKTVVIVGIEGLPHWVSYSYPQLAWDFMKNYSIVDGKRVYTEEKVPAPETLVKRDDGFYSYYDENSQLVKFDYVMMDDGSLYFFNSKGIGVEIDYVKLSDHVIQIFDNTNDSAFIVIGDTQAAVIDGMNGTVDLLKIAKFFTDKPLVAVLTHGHGDHTGGVQSFDEVHLNEADFELYKSMISGDFRFGMIGYDNYLADTGSTLNYTLVNIREDFMDQNPNLKLIPIKDSEIFDLGGVSIECIAAPGHTAGSMAMLIREDRVLVTGDAANKYTQVQGYPVEGYLKTLLKLKAREADYDDIYSSHGALKPDGTNTAHMADTLIDELIEGCQSILDGTNEGVVVDPNAPVRWAYAMGPSGRADGKCGNFMFNTQLIRVGAETQTPSQIPSQTTTYTVKKGDNLSAIAKKLLGSSAKWTAIYEANRDTIKNPNLIYVGQVLGIPAN